MTVITAETTVGEIVRAAPVRARIFERLGVDYCCRGKKPLVEACRAKGLDPATVVALLSALGREDAGGARIDVDAMGLAERERAGISEGLVRLSIGVEDVEDLIDDLDWALATA